MVAAPGAEGRNRREPPIEAGRGGNWGSRPEAEPREKDNKGLAEAQKRKYRQFWSEAMVDRVDYKERGHAAQVRPEQGISAPGA